MCANMGEPSDYDTEWSKSDTIWHYLNVESNMWHRWTYLQNRNRLADIENKFMVAKGKGDGGGINQDLSDTDHYTQNTQTTRSHCIA